MYIKIPRNLHSTSSFIYTDASPNLKSYYYYIYSLQSNHFLKGQKLTNIRKILFSLFLNLKLHGLVPKKPSLERWSMVGWSSDHQSGFTVKMLGWGFLPLGLPRFLGGEIGSDSSLDKLYYSSSTTSGCFSCVTGSLGIAVCALSFLLVVISVSPLGS
jgi:hypothetical protein